MTAKLRKFYETGNQVNDESLVCVFEDFLSDSEVERVLALAEPSSSSLWSAQQNPA
jgi:hypothetical protein